MEYKGKMLNGSGRAVTALIGAGLITACASTPSDNTPLPASPQIQTVQAGDSALSCDDLQTQIATLDKLTQLPGGGGPTNKQVATNMASGAAGAVAARPVAGAIPAVGGLVSLGLGLMQVGDARTVSAKARDDTNTRMEAMQRKQYLVGIYQQKKC